MYATNQNHYLKDQLDALHLTFQDQQVNTRLTAYILWD